MHEEQICLPISKNKFIVLLATILVMIVALAISESGWMKELPLIRSVGLVAIIIGLMISRSLLPGLIAHTFSMTIGLGWTFWQVSRLSPGDTWIKHWEDMMYRLGKWFSIFSDGGINYDNLMFIFQMSMIMWIISYMTIWYLFRGNSVWKAVVPGGVVLLINLYYAPKDLTIWFIIFLIVASLVIIRFNLLDNESRWRAEQVYYRSDIIFDFMRDGLIVSIIIIGIAWYLPGISQVTTIRLLGKFDRQWRKVQTEWNRMFASLNYRNPNDQLVENFGQSLTLSGARYLTPELVMTVFSDEGRYWRAAAYDKYDGDVWSSTNDKVIPFERNDTPASVATYKSRIPVTQTYSFSKDGAYVLPALASPVFVNREALADVSIITPHELNISPINYWTGRVPPFIEEITFIESDLRLKANEPYQIISHYSTASVDELRSDSNMYPFWIIRRYLEMPDTTTQRVRSLALEITNNETNAYDKATKIEQYLRQEITYNDAIYAPPPNRDKVDYILFELKEAYCDYYATAMIVMLRSVGVPSRLAAGYAQGERQALENQKQIYFVQSDDAHSWVEVFFPSYGWIEFEPTASELRINRQTSVLQGTGDNKQNIPDGGIEDEDPFDRMDDARDVELPPGSAEPIAGTGFITLPIIGQISLATIIFGFLFIGLFAAFIGIGIWQLQTMSQSQNVKIEADTLLRVDEVYHTLVKLARWLGVKKLPSQTPYEHAEDLNQTMPAIKLQVNTITNAFVHHMFSGRTDIANDTKVNVAQSWSEIKPIIQQAIIKRFSQFYKWIKVPSFGSFMKK
ncbi:MAG: hypothetical protein B6242_12980 [Anaerolineaceae bacterium 4572_78]|nr:MAG: hypothetical protein B6242_12980 [Anaerolineaceae bacterium 4572_78]